MTKKFPIDFPRKTSVAKRPAMDLEEQLAGVVEREGVIMQTPLGPKRGRKQAKAWQDKIQAPTAEVQAADSAQTDSVLEMDRVAVELAVKSPGERERKVGINYVQHERSPYLISLQKILINPAKSVERLPVVGEVYSLPVAPSAPVEVYATLTHDLTHPTADPWRASEQFTPPDFDEAYSASYGRFDWLGSAVHEISDTFTSLFRRAEKAETCVVKEVEDSLATIQVPKFSYARALAGFAALALFVTLPANAVMLYRSVSATKAEATQAGEQAVDNLIQAGSATNIPDSADALKRASGRFREADAYLGKASALAVGLASVVPSQYRSARALLEVGDKSSAAARLLAVGLDKVFSDPDRRIDERLDVLAAYARSSLQLLSDASKAAATVDPSNLPEDKRESVTALLDQIDQSQSAIREFAVLADAVSQMAGRDHERNYLVIFQNNTELRPTGGFMGSFAEVSLDRGAIKKISVPAGGSYAIKGQLQARVISPKPLQLINPLWQFQDSNWFPDFPQSAEKIRWFWSKAGQPTIDGVITVNASFMDELLKLTGPIDMPEYGKVITPENFMLETQKAVELEYDKESNTPKKFVGDLMDKVMEKLKSMDKDGWLQLATVTSQALETKDIQIAFFNEEEETLAEKFGWNGRLKDVYGDSLALIEANVAGQKTDGVIQENVDHHVVISADGSIEDTLTFDRTHTGQKGELFRGVRNVTYLRAYVPSGSKLLSASGFDAPDSQLFKTVADDQTTDSDVSSSETTIADGQEGVTVTQEGTRTVFGGWLQLDPGEHQTVTLRYRLPFAVSDILGKLDQGQASSEQSARGAYLLLLTSQSGKTDRKLTSHVTLPSSWTVSWSKPGSEDLRFSGDWDRDRVMAAILTPTHGQEISPQIGGAQ